MHKHLIICISLWRRSWDCDMFGSISMVSQLWSFSQFFLLCSNESRLYWLTRESSLYVQIAFRCCLFVSQVGLLFVPFYLACYSYYLNGLDSHQNRLHPCIAQPRVTVSIMASLLVTRNISEIYHISETYDLELREQEEWKKSVISYQSKHLYGQHNNIKSQKDN